MFYRARIMMFLSVIVFMASCGYHVRGGFDVIGSHMVRDVHGIAFVRVKTNGVDYFRDRHSSPRYVPKQIVYEVIRYDFGKRYAALSQSVDGMHEKSLQSKGYEYDPLLVDNGLAIAPRQLWRMKEVECNSAGIPSGQVIATCSAGRPGDAVYLVQRSTGTGWVRLFDENDLRSEIETNGYDNDHWMTPVVASSSIADSGVYVMVASGKRDADGHLLIVRDVGDGRSKIIHVEEQKRLDIAAVSIDSGTESLLWEQAGVLPGEEAEYVVHRFEKPNSQWKEVARFKQKYGMRLLFAADRAEVYFCEVLDRKVILEQVDYIRGTKRTFDVRQAAL